MPKWMRRLFHGASLGFHLWMAMFIGLGLRVCSAIFVYGPQALDDYKHGVWPAYQFFSDQPMDLPAYRSPLLVWFLSGFVRLAYTLDFDSALAQVRAMYLGLGMTSLCGIYGTYLYVRHFRSQIFGALALYLVALFPLMPFVSTRAFGEAVAMSLVAFAFGVLESARRSSYRGFSHWLFGFLLLGLATLFRFHVGLLFVAYMGALIALRYWRGFWVGVIAGLITLVGAAAVDVAAAREPLSTLLIYLSENQGGAAKYGVMPWYNPLLFVLGVSLAPMVFLMWRQTKALWLRHRTLLVPFGIFLFAHMMAAHKEERFLYPILVLELWWVAFLWSSAARNKWVRRIYAPTMALVILVALPVVCLVNTQEGEIEPPAVIENKYKHVLFYDFESLFGQSRFQFYFLRPPSVLQAITAADFSAHTVDQGLSQHKELKAVAFLSSSQEGYDRLRTIEGISTMEAECLSIKRSGSVMDRLLFALNAKHNQRRRPTWYMVCERRKR